MTRPARRSRVAAAAVAVAVSALAVACGGGDGEVTDVGAAPGRPTTTGPTSPAGPSTTSTTTTSTTAAPTSSTTAPGPTASTATPATTAPATTTVTVWLVDAGGAAVPVERPVAAVEGIGAEAVRSLLSGPTPGEAAVGLSTAIPPATRLLGLDIGGGTATVDLSGEFESGGGSASVFLRLAQVVCTLDAFPTVDGVLFHLDGEPVSVFSGEGVVLDGPVACSDYEATTGAPGGAAEDGFEVANAVESFLAAREAGSGWESWITEDAAGAYEVDPADGLAFEPVDAWSIASITGAGPFDVTVTVDDHVEVLTVRNGLAADGTRRDHLVVAARLG